MGCDSGFYLTVDMICRDCDQLINQLCVSPMNEIDGTVVVICDHCGSSPGLPAASSGLVAMPRPGVVSEFIYYIVDTGSKRSEDLIASSIEEMVSLLKWEAEKYDLSRRKVTRVQMTNFPAVEMIRGMYRAGRHGQGRSTTWWTTDKMLDVSLQAIRSVYKDNSINVSVRHFKAPDFLKRFDHEHQPDAARTSADEGMQP